ncbi:MAG: phosphoglucomutase/phosphomannomutase family protein [Candidatus Omnitrophota bacterium]
MQNIKFGTDGWRGIIGSDFTFDNVRIVAQAIADYIKPQTANHKPQTVVVGYDTRFLSAEFAKAIAEVLAGNGIKVLLATHPTPTPLISFTIKDRKLTAGVIVTASHNPPRYNGIKFKANYGGPADPSITGKIEALLGRNKIKILPLGKGLKTKLIQTPDLNSRYMGFIKKYLDMNLLKKKKYRILVDVMHGVGDKYIARLFEKTNIKVDTIHADADPSFAGIAPEPIEKNLQELIRRTKKGKYDIGLAVDGDADRIGVVRPDGRFVSSGEIIALLTIHFYEDKKWRGEIAKTISSTSLIEKVAQNYNLKLHETPVGFKYICKLMLTNKILVGGEESGGIGFKNYPPERDGMVAGLLLVEMMAHRKKGIMKIMDEMEKKYKRHHYMRDDAAYPDNLKKKLFAKLARHPLKELMGIKVVQTKTYDGCKFIAEDGSWILFRLSGTEPILRIYVEAFTEKRLNALMKFGKKYAFSV